MEEGDRIVVCTDGLFNELSGEEITSVMAGGENMTAIVDILIDRALTNGGRDNVSIVVAEVAA
jgi:protein phosphatase